MTDNIGKSPEAWRNYTTKVPIAAFRMKRDDLKRLYQIINNKKVEYRDKLWGNLFKVPPESDEGFAERKLKVHDAFVTSVSVTGLDGEIVTGNNEAFFESPNVPEQLRSVFISTKSVPRAMINLTPICNVVVFLDFSRPPILDFNTLPTLPTPNESNFAIFADNESWFMSTNAKLTQFFSERKTNTNWLHRAAVYDILLSFLAVPISIWLAYRVGAFIEKTTPPSMSMCFLLYVCYLGYYFHIQDGCFQKLNLTKHRHLHFATGAFGRQ